MKGKCFLICMLLWGMSCVKAQTSDVDKMFPNVVLTRENYDKVKTALDRFSDELVYQTDRNSR